MCDSEKVRTRKGECTERGRDIEFYGDQEQMHEIKEK